MKAKSTLFTKNQSAAHQCFPKNMPPRFRATAPALSIALFLAALVSYPAQGQTFTVLYSFTGGDDGRSPSADLVSDAAGNLYGTTGYGGTHSCSFGLGCGIVFKLSPGGTQTVLYDFTGGSDGAQPAGLVRDAAGNLYGTTAVGGDLSCGFSSGCGTVFKLSPGGVLIVLHTFTGPPDGEAPGSRLIRDAAGNLYGTTSYGGDAACASATGNCGTVFKVDASGNETVLHAFTGKPDGEAPFGSLVQDGSGNLFGTTRLGGDANDDGTVFKIDSAGNETVLHTFTGADGSRPETALVLIGQDLYGSTNAGGAFSLGEVFKLSKTGQLTIVHSFGGGKAGSQPQNFTHDALGNLYGVTSQDGAFGYGVAFKLDTHGREFLLHAFSGGPDGGNPFARLLRDSAGSLFGTTSIGGALGYGTVFKIRP
jgi:uncharacterized repeat protein (TIGR03803 family)